MKLLRILIILGTISTLFTFSHCEVEEVQCQGFNRKNLIFSISMFQTLNEELLFIGQSDTLILEKNFYGFSKPYIERCGVYPDPNCSCYSSFEGTYTLNDSIYFRTQLGTNTSEENMGTVYLGIDVNKFHYGTYDIPNSHDSIKTYIESIIVDNLIVNDLQFNNALDIKVLDHSSIKRIIIEKDVGLVAFDYKEQFYSLNEE